MEIADSWSSEKWDTWDAVMAASDLAWVQLLLFPSQNKFKL